ncbi:MAG TPA: hypothetical protein ENJ28_01940 [Gammaproteobacteria bacterium]|nr:hypothetical protein [Gammaproteobacteria bacterium]
MKWSQWLEEWGLTKLKINAGFLEMELQPEDHDRDAAWEMYIELLTRITTQALPTEDGDEQTALESIYSLFGTTRDIIKRHSRHAKEFTKIAIVVLNQIVRPFTAKWHKHALANGFEDVAMCEEFREELMLLQKDLRIYTAMLGDMAGFEEDLTLLEQVNKV